VSGADVEKEEDNEERLQVVTVTVRVARKIIRTHSDSHELIGSGSLVFWRSPSIAASRSISIPFESPSFSPGVMIMLAAEMSWWSIPPS
jgi:hypothetical protein